MSERIVSRTAIVATVAAIIIFGSLAIITSYMPTSHAPARSDSATVAPAKNTAPPETKPVPVVLLGIEVGKPLSVPVCKKKRVKIIDGSYDTQLVPATCVKRSEFSNSDYDVQAPSPDYISGTPHITIWKGVVGNIRISTTGWRGQDQADTDLSGKFGEPDSSKIDRLQNAFGAQFNSITKNWVLGDNMIYFHGVSEDDVNTGIISAITNEYALHLDKEIKPEPRL